MAQYISERTIGGRVWEDGTFGISFVKTLPLEPAAYSPDRAQHEENARWLHQLSVEHGSDVAGEYLAELLGREDPSSTLGLSTVLNSHTDSPERARRGLLGISSYGKKLVRNACLRLDRESEGDLSFLTLTLPDVSHAEAAHLAKNWAEVIRRFNQWLKRALQRCGLPGESVGVTELQSARFAHSGVFALHYHACFVGRQSRYHAWALKPLDIRASWQNILLNYLSYTQEHYDWRSVENIQQVRKSVGSYLGKYLSKGLGYSPSDPSTDRDTITDLYPTAWYSCSNSLRVRVLALRSVLSNASANHLLNICSQGDWDEWFHWVKPICLFSDGGFTVAGWAGKLTDDGLVYFKSGGCLGG